MTLGSVSGRLSCVIIGKDLQKNSSQKPGSHMWLSAGYCRSNQIIHQIIHKRMYAWTAVNNDSASIPQAYVNQAKHGWGEIIIRQLYIAGIEYIAGGIGHRDKNTCTNYTVATNVNITFLYSVPLIQWLLLCWVRVLIFITRIRFPLGNYHWPRSQFPLKKNFHGQKIFRKYHC